MSIKRFSFLATIALLVALAFPAISAAQATGYDVTTVGGSLSTNGNALVAPLSNVTYLLNDNTNVGGTATGSLVFQTGNLATGDFQNGGTFAPGGSITISATNANDSVSFSGTITSASWAAGRNANGTYFYTLTCAIQDSTTGNTGAFVLSTVNGAAVNLKFTGSTLITSVHIHLN